MKFTTQLHLFLFSSHPSNSSSNMLFLLPSGGQSSCLNFRHVQVIKNCHDDKWVTISRKFHSLIIKMEERVTQCSSEPYYTASEKNLHSNDLWIDRRKWGAKKGLIALNQKIRSCIFYSFFISHTSEVDARVSN